MNARDKEESMTLEILEAIGDGEQVSQRNLASSLGVALGLTNSYLKRCIKKGFIKIHQAPANRYLYYLTPQGFSEKSRLTAQYLSYSLNLYRKSVQAFEAVFSECHANGWNRLVLVGKSDLADIAILHAGTLDLEIVDTLSTSNGKAAIRNAIEEIRDEFDVLVITDLLDPAGIYELLGSVVDDNKILVPDVLGVAVEKKLNKKVS